MTFLDYIEPHDQALHDALWDLLKRIEAQIDVRAAAAQREIHAMAVRDRRGIAQMTRRDNFWRRGVRR